MRQYGMATTLQTHLSECIWRLQTRNCCYNFKNIFCFLLCSYIYCLICIFL